VISAFRFTSGLDSILTGTNRARFDRELVYGAGAAIGGASARVGRAGAAVGSSSLPSRL
jgi:hypothetical protein